MSFNGRNLMISRSARRNRIIDDGKIWIECRHIREFGAIG